jgi:hypothetical protein
LRIIVAALPKFIKFRDSYILICLYRERLGQILGIVGVSSSGGISFWVAHGAFGFFSMADLKLLKKVHLLPKLSLATCLQEYYDWEEHMEDSFWGRGLESALKMYYAEETMAKDILHW